MTDKDKERIENAIRHIKSSVDVDTWAMEIAVDAMLKQLSDQESDRQVTGKLDDIYDALSRVYNMDRVPDEAKSIIGDVMLGLPSAQPEHETCRLIDAGYDVDGTHYYMCSACGSEFSDGDEYNYCPYCGKEAEGDPDAESD